MRFKVLQNIRDGQSDEVKDLIGRPPSWILLNGNIIIVFVLILILIGAWFIKYPDIISAPVNISSIDPPVKLIARANGKIVNLNSKDGDYVQANAVIAVIDNAAKYDDILMLKKLVVNLDTAIDIRKVITVCRFPEQLTLGELQSEYAVLYETMTNYYYFLNNKLYQSKIADINIQNNINENLAGIIKNKAVILKDQLLTDAWRDSANLILLQQKVISLAEYNELKKVYQNKQLNISDNLNSLLQNRQRQSDLKRSLIEINQNFKTEELNLVQAVKISAKKIRGYIDIWEKEYVFKTPISGKLALFGIRKVNQYVNSGTAVFMVVPAKQQFEVRVSLPIYKAGKVIIGQRVLIKLNEYPFEEYGYLTALVKEVSNVAIDSAYLVNIEVDKDWITTRNRVIEFRPQITGIAEIVTNDKNIIERLFEGLYGKIMR